MGLRGGSGLEGGREGHDSHTGRVTALGAEGGRVREESDRVCVSENGKASGRGTGGPLSCAILTKSLS